MPLLYSYTNPIRGIWKITESSEELLSQIDNRDSYMSGLSKLHTEKRKREWLAARLLTNILLKGEYTIAYKENGAPYLLESDLHISISHTKEYVAVLLQETPFAGIDIERISERIMKVQDRILSPAEKEMTKNENATEHSLICWCAKETLFKMIPEENIDFREHLHIKPFPFSASGDICAYETKSPDKRMFNLAFEVMPDFVWVWSTDQIAK